MPPASISSPESIKKGIAIRLKELMEENSFCATSIEEILSSIKIAPTEPRPSENAMGTPSIKNTKNNINAVTNIHTPPRLFHPAFHSNEPDNN